MSGRVPVVLEPFRVVRVGAVGGDGAAARPRAGGVPGLDQLSPQPFGTWPLDEDRLDRAATSVSVDALTGLASADSAAQEHRPGVVLEPAR